MKGNERKKEKEKEKRENYIITKIKLG